MPAGAFYYLKDGKPVGPVAYAELQRLAAAGQIVGKDLVCPVGGQSWTPAGQVEGLFAAPAPPPPPPAPPLSAPAASPAASAPTRGAAPTTSPAPAVEHDVLAEAAVGGFEHDTSGRAAPAAGGDAGPKVKSALRWITTTLAGAAVFAVVGLLFVCCGGCGMAWGFWTSRSPTKVTIAELEKSTKPPESDWLEIKDGNLFWPEMVRDLKDAKKGDKTEKGEALWYYVPLVSKDVLAEWEPEYDREGSHARFSYAKARVILKISPERMKQDFPAIVDKKTQEVSSAKNPVQGTVGAVKGVPENVMKGIKASAKDQDLDRMIVLNYGESVSSSGWTGICMGIVLWILALPLFIPLVMMLGNRIRGR